MESFGMAFVPYVTRFGYGRSDFSHQTAVLLNWFRNCVTKQDFVFVTKYAKLYVPTLRNLVNKTIH